MMDKYQLYHGDCLEVMAGLEAQSFDAIIADIPSGRTACAWDRVIPFEPMWTCLKRLAKPRAAIVLLGCTQPFTSALVMSNPKWFRYDWVWVKNTCVGAGAATYQPMRYSESICVFSNLASVFNPQPALRTRPSALARYQYKQTSGSEKSNHMKMANITTQYDPIYKQPSNVLEFDSVPNYANRLHPTQKPLPLLEYLIRTYTNEGDTVLDFAAGSGTTGHACANTCRRFVGIEKDLSYFTIAQSRIADAYAPLERMMSVAVGLGG